MENPRPCPQPMGSEGNAHLMFPVNWCSSSRATSLGWSDLLVSACPSLKWSQLSQVRGFTGTPQSFRALSLFCKLLLSHPGPCSPIHSTLGMYMVRLGTSPHSWGPVLSNVRNVLASSGQAGGLMLILLDVTWSFLLRVQAWWVSIPRARAIASNGE